MPAYVPPPRIRKQYAMEMAQQCNNNESRFEHYNMEMPAVPAMRMMNNNKRRQSYSDDDEESDGDDMYDKEDSVPSLRENSQSESASISLSASRSDNIYVHNNNRKHTFYYQQKTPSQSPTPLLDPIATTPLTADTGANLTLYADGVDTIDSCQFELDLRKTNTPCSTASSSESPGLHPNHNQILFPMMNMSANNNMLPMMMNNNHYQHHTNNQPMPSMSPDVFLFPPPSNVYPQQQHRMFNYNMTPPMPAYIPMQQEGECFVCVDVECAATGYGHYDSAPCRIAMVDFFGEVLFDRIAQVPNLIDPLSEFTGLTKWEIQNKGDSLQNVLSEFHALLSSLNKQYQHGVTIIGQSVIMDIVWAALVPNLHYQRVIDIAHLFKTKNAKWDSYMFYSLRQVAYALLNCQMNTEFHDPTEDAAVTIKLWRDFCLDPEQLAAAKHVLRSFKSGKYNKFPDFTVYTAFNQCSGMYNPSKCHCGQKTAVHIDGMNDMEKLRDLYLEHRSKPVLYDDDEEHMF